MHKRMQRRRRTHSEARASTVDSAAPVATARDTFGVNRDLRSCNPHDAHCHLCGDEAVVGCVLDIDHSARLATVDFGNEVATVALDLVHADVGDRLLVHLGFAIARLEPT